MSEDKSKVEVTDGAAEEKAEAVETTESAETTGAPDVAEETATDKADAEEQAETSEDANEADDKESADGEREAAESNDKYMRLMAEFQNYKKRVAKEKSDIHAYANENIVSGLLEVIDNFERALESDAAADAEGYAKGMELTLTKMLDVLTKAGLAEIPALGEDFDPALHNAVMTEESDEYESGKVSKVMQKGYTLNNKVIRPSMVAVAK